MDYAAPPWPGCGLRQIFPLTISPFGQTCQAASGTEKPRIIRSRYRKYTVTRNLLTLFLLLMSLNLQGQNATIENEYSFTGSLGYNSHFGTEATIGIFLLDKDSSQSGFIYSFEVGSNYNLETFDLFINLAAIWSVGIGGTGFEIAFVFNDLNTEYYFSVRPQYSVHLTPFLTFRPGLDFSSAEIIPYFTVVIGWF
jgi:hypothetical protein